MDHGEIRLGVIGCGAFGLFALQQFAQVPGVKLAGMAGTHREADYAAARRFGIPDIEDVGKMVQRDDIDLIYIATPPFLHHPQAIEALRAGKHVICEKPLAMTVAEADEIIAEARRRNRLLVVNLMQRYNPASDAIGRLVQAKVLGEVLHGYFENYASDENLGPGHWFWDQSKSGGIFIEHGVHFFDLFAGWLGPGQVVAAQRGLRPGASPPLEEHVHCTVRYGQTVMVNFYHGFHQTGRMDRQELRLVFERGDVTMYDWVPTRVRIHAIADEAQTRALCELFPGARLDVTVTYAPKDRSCEGRHKSLDVYQMLELTWGEGTAKMHRYGELLRALLADQLAWVRDRSHSRKITDQNGRDSLAIACEADRMAQADQSKEQIMALKRLFESLLLRPADIKPSRDDFEVVSVFNPGAVRVRDEVVLLVRVAERPREARPGYTGLPRWNKHGELAVDWVSNEELEPVDPRVVRRKTNGLVRLTFTSHLRVVRCGNGRSVEEITDIRFLPGSELEEFGVEDARITPLYGRYYFTYVAVSRHGAATALASTTDFRDFSRQGTIFCCENKDVVLFPEQIAGAYVALHRPNPATPFCRPEMWIAWSQDIMHWGRHGILHGGGADWETGRVGAGTPPVRLPEGWLEIYHGSHHTTEPGAVGKYSSGAMLLHLENPAQILRRTPDTIFVPTAEFERSGFVPNVVFPTGIVETEDTFLVYYGAADTCTAVVELSREELMANLIAEEATSHRLVP